MEAMIQSVNSSANKPESQTAESFAQPPQPFQEVFFKQIVSNEEKGANSPTTSPKSHTASGPLRPEPSPEETIQKQASSADKDNEKNKDVESGKVAANSPLNILPILPNLRERSNLIRFDPSQAESLDQSLSQPESMIQDLQARSILPLAGTAENPEQNIAFSTMPPNAILITGTIFQNTPWTTGNEDTKNSSLKSEWITDLLGQKLTLPVGITDSSLPLEFDEKLNFLLGQNSTGAKFQGQSLNGEFSELGNSSAEKDNPKMVSAGGNHPLQEPFDANGAFFGGWKPPTIAEESGTSQSPQLSKIENIDLYQQVTEKVIWSIRNNEENIQLTLEPPQLGSLFIELHRDKEEIKASLWADNPKTKEILENNQFQLQKTLEGHGFKLEKYDVFLQNDMASFQGKEERPIFNGHGSQAQILQIEKTESPVSLEIPSGILPASGRSQYIDLFI